MNTPLKDIIFVYGTAGTTYLLVTFLLLSPYWPKVRETPTALMIGIILGGLLTGGVMTAVLFG